MNYIPVDISWMSPESRTRQILEEMIMSDTDEEEHQAKGDRKKEDPQSTESIPSIPNPTQKPPHKYDDADYSPCTLSPESSREPTPVPLTPKVLRNEPFEKVVQIAIDVLEKMRSESGSGSGSRGEDFEMRHLKVFFTGSEPNLSTIIEKLRSKEIESRSEVEFRIAKIIEKTKLQHQKGSKMYLKAEYLEQYFELHWDAVVNWEYHETELNDMKVNLARIQKNLRK